MMLFNPEITGKPVGSDLERGKKNPLILTTLENAGADRKFLLNHLGLMMNKDDLSKSIEIVEKYGNERIESMRDEYIEEAVEILQRLPDNELRELVTYFANYCGSREKQS